MSSGNQLEVSWAVIVASVLVPPIGQSLFCQSPTPIPTDHSGIQDRDACRSAVAMCFRDDPRRKHCAVDLSLETGSKQDHKQISATVAIRARAGGQMMKYGIGQKNDDSEKGRGRASALPLNALQSGDGKTGRGIRDLHDEILHGHWSREAQAFPNDCLRNWDPKFVTEFHRRRAGDEGTRSHQGGPNMASRATRGGVAPKKLMGRSYRLRAWE